MLKSPKSIFLESRKKPAENKQTAKAVCYLSRCSYSTVYVGVAVGMGDANYFSRMFRKVEGISPREYRKQW